MKILYHHRTQAKGVEGVHIQGVINALREQGNDVQIVALINNPKTERDDSSKNKKNVKNSSPGLWRNFLNFFANHAPNFIFRLAEILYNIVAFFKICKVLTTKDIDIIYERYAYFNFSGILAAKLYKKPLILEVNIFTGLNDARLLALSPIAEAIEKKVFLASNAIFVISDYLKDKMIQRYGLEKEKIHVHPNAVDPNQLEYNAEISVPCLDLITPHAVIIGFLGRLLPWYKLHELVDVFAAIQKKHPHTQLLFVGDGPERVNIENDLKRLGVINKVIFCGSVIHEQALALLKKCDIGVIPSTNLWGSPMKLFEYMGSGLPVVAPNIGVITAVMTDNLHGRLFEYDNFKDFENALEMLVRNKDLRESMGKNAKQHILENHSWEKVSRHIIDVAEDLTLKSN
ncbi:MAG TPA: glycosyltransferase family 4 protein [Roseivirga sp.]